MIQYVGWTHDIHGYSSTGSWCYKPAKRVRLLPLHHAFLAHSASASILPSCDVCPNDSRSDYQTWTSASKSLPSFVSSKEPVGPAQTDHSDAFPYQTPSRFLHRLSRRAYRRFIRLRSPGNMSECRDGTGAGSHAAEGEDGKRGARSGTERGFFFLGYER